MCEASGLFFAWTASLFGVNVRELMGTGRAVVRDSLKPPSVPSLSPRNYLNVFE